MVIPISIFAYLHIITATLHILQFEQDLNSDVIELGYLNKTLGYLNKAPENRGLRSLHTEFISHLSLPIYFSHDLNTLDLVGRLIGRMDSLR